MKFEIELPREVYFAICDGFSAEYSVLLKRAFKKAKQTDKADKKKRS